MESGLVPRSRAPKAPVRPGDGLTTFRLVKAVYIGQEVPQRPELVRPGDRRPGQDREDRSVLLLRERVQDSSHVRVAEALALTGQPEQARQLVHHLRLVKAGADTPLAAAVRFHHPQFPLGAPREGAGLPKSSRRSVVVAAWKSWSQLSLRLTSPRMRLFRLGRS